MPKKIIGYLLFVLALFACANNNNESNEAPPEDTTKIDPADISDTEYTPTDAYDYVNHLRETAGLILLSPNTLLESAADNHANYLAINNVQGHNETPGLSGFTGETPSDRGNSAGYLSRDIAEGIAFQDGYQNAIDGLFSAIYHRLTLLDLEHNEIGISYVALNESASSGVLVHNMANKLKNDLCNGSSFTQNGTYYSNICLEETFRIAAETYEDAAESKQKENPQIVTWPATNGSAIPPAFFEETPDPLPDYGVSGYPVSVQFNPAFVDSVILNSFDLYDESGAKVSPVRLLDNESDPAGSLTLFEFALFPLERLDWNSTYKVEINYSINGESAINKSWFFKTRNPTNALVKVESEEVGFNIQNNVPTAFYLVPAAPFDTIESISYQFPQDVIVDSSFVDGNTLLFTIAGNSNQQVDVELTLSTSLKRQLIITIE